MLQQCMIAAAELGCHTCSKVEGQGQLRQVERQLGQVPGTADARPARQRQPFEVRQGSKGRLQQRAPLQQPCDLNDRLWSVPLQASALMAQDQSLLPPHPSQCRAPAAPSAPQRPGAASVSPACSSRG